MLISHIKHNTFYSWKWDDTYINAGDTIGVLKIDKIKGFWMQMQVCNELLGFSW